MTLEEWEILLSFSRRVKTVTLDARDSDEEIHAIDACVYRALSACPLSNLFPKLHTLHVQGSTMYNSKYRLLMTSDLLLSSSLRAIRVTSMFPNSFFSDAPLLTKFCPLVESFSCLHNTNPRLPDDGELELLTKTLCQWEHLRTVDCGALNQDILTHLTKASPPSLGHLSVPVSTAAPWLSGQYGVREISRLSLNVDGIDTFSRALKALLLDENSTVSPSFLSASPVARLHTVQFVPSTRPNVVKPSPRPPSLIFTSLAECVSHAYLTSITLSESNRSSIIPPHGYLTKDALSPLRAFSMLTELMIDFHHHPIMLEDVADNEDSDRDENSDEALTVLVSCWPRLERLQLKTLQRPASLAGLFAVLESCPRLAYLNIAVRVDPRQVDVAAESISESKFAGSTTVTQLPHNSVITWLDITHASERLHDIEPLAKVLHHVVPSLRTCNQGEPTVTSNMYSHLCNDETSVQAARAWLSTWDHSDRYEITSIEWSINFWTVVFAEMMGLVKVERE
ncbi:hypothetical protein CONPUDRAFT_147168 [Coniophora puteana RWD-64-598 SS2]|uniref:F-box domain-containing protein n=1 Tax=Coniophora puteana (strain RWD-64-598) TaxID=741705 RepID=A0A5M3M9F2_CONPW|nr:uncharacterized protein CONPUDRAFT_147168 [Coniophora puteana RWD-64-598 SS2]EIW75566.1 hypothetical protein CONPUDRAFT_147168 [Coniophora puteana RWD-64-598 SS2]